WRRRFSIEFGDPSSYGPWAGDAAALHSGRDRAFMIKFLCPSGHPLTAPESLAGKAGKCPKCNTPFVVPAADEAGRSAVGGGSTAAAPVAVAVAEGSGTDFPAPVTPAMGSGVGKGAGGEVFVFLCPNGHKLNGPPSMKGKAGQCPHCGAKFRIPTDEDLAE